MEKLVMKSVDRYMEEFITRVHETFGISREQLEGLWVDIKKKKTVKKHSSSMMKGGRKKKSNWMIFCEQHRSELSHLSFSEIAKELSRRWKLLNEDQKSMYTEEHLKNQIQNQKSPPKKKKRKTVPPPPTVLEDIPLEEEEKVVDKEPCPADFSTEKEKEVWNHFREMKISHLREMCNRFGLQTSVNRREMILGLCLYRLANDDS